MNKLAKKVLLVGWDGADWKIINKLMDSGQMPAVESIVNHGVMANLATLEPPFSPMLWTSIATGMRPDKHGILGFTEPTPDKIGIRPVSSTSRKVKAIWNILTQEKYKTHVIGWWPSHPVEQINGIMISNHYHKTKTDPENWTMARATVHPVEYTGLFKELRIHPAELTEAHILPFVPEAAKVDQDKDKRLYNIAKNIAEASTMHAATTWIMENQDWDFLAVYLDSIDHFSHGFMNFHPPKMENIPDDLYNLYKDVINGAYRYHDMMLGRLLQLAGDDTTVMLLSDHGFHSDHLRPRNIPEEPAGPAYQHRQHGIFCMKGPHIKKDERIHGTSLLNITPTILTLFGLPIGDDMDGAPLIQAFENEIEIETIPSWENVAGYAGMHPEEFKEDTYEVQEALNQLVELGYIEEPGDNIQKAVNKTITESEYNLARVYLGSNRSELAIPLLEKISADNPEQSRFVLRLALAYMNIGETGKCKIAITEFRKTAKNIILSEKEIQELKKQIKPEEDTEQKNIDKIKEQNKLIKDKIKAGRQAKNDLIRIDLMETDILVKENKPLKALKMIEGIQEKIPAQKNLYLQVANIYLKLNKWDDARQKFREALELDGENQVAHYGVGLTFLRTKSYYEAIDEFLTAIGLLYHYPAAHYHLGEALMAINEYEKAEEAFNVCLKISPGMSAARNNLIDIYENILKQPLKAEQHKQFFKNKALTEVQEISITSKQNDLLDEKTKLKAETKPNKVASTKRQNFLKPIVVVSGLPRSGTSMMMQMLEAAGMEIYSDERRKADENNPKGYYEHEAVKRLARHKAWLSQTEDKAVKVISHLLIHLPAVYNYKIIFMLRDINEIIVSQHKMLVSKGKAKKENYPAGLEIAYKKNLDKVKHWIKRNHNAEILYLNHRDVINDSLEAAGKVKEFIDKNVNVNDMASVIEKKLYRTQLK